MKPQTHLHSILEALCNTVVGFTLTFVILEFESSLGNITMVALAIQAMQTFKNYLVRRVFNYMQKKKAKKKEQEEKHHLVEIYNVANGTLEKYHFKRRDK